MVCFVVMGNDAAVAQAAAAGQLELNVMMPVMANVLLRSIDYLINYLPVFETRCVRGITADADRLKEKVMQNPALITLLNRQIGYLPAAEVAKESVRTGRPVIELVVEKGLLTKSEADKVFSVDMMVNRTTD
jgi:aspartate ammonia-lyase